MRTARGIPEVAVDPSGGKLYVVWQDGRFSRDDHDDIALASSPDGGRHWTVPRRVNTPTGWPAFTPSVAVDASGIVGITYYDFRSMPTAPRTGPIQLLTSYWFTSSRDGGATFGHETRLAGPFDIVKAPNARGFFLGDYEGLAAAGTRFQSLFARVNPGDPDNRTDIVTTTIEPTCDRMSCP